ncbi:MAG: zinc metalloprotease, partial [Bacteroidota bacterium]
MKLIKPVCFIAFLLVFAGIGYGQKNAKTIPEKCGTMQNLELLWQANPQLKVQFEEERNRFNKALRQGTYRLTGAQNANRSFITIPVVFHVVLNNQSLVTDAQILAQLDTINKDYAGLNGDSVRVPSYFKSVFGQSSIQFCLAKQTPTGDPTSGIERTVTAQTSFTNTDNGVKHAASGGANAWDPSSYLNVWICQLSNGLLGYGTFPGTGNDNEQGVVIEYRSIPGSTALPQYNGGKTLTHEIGHYFNLYHIWGDDNGACTGTDYIDDTPNQANSSSACSSGIVTDNCTPTGNGIMYQNYMDYTYDNCLVMFTVQQVARMESALVAYRSSLLTSIGCQTPVSYNLD